SMIVCPPSGVATLLPSATAAPPAATISAATSAAGAASAPSPSIDPPRSFTTTLAPRAASRSACARPIPRPAPVTTATRPSNRYSLTWSGGHRDFEAEQPTQRAAEHRGPLVVGDAGEQLRDQLAAAAEGPFRVRVVVAPHDARDARQVPARHRHRVVLELHVELARHVLARLQRVWPLVVEAEQLRHRRLVRSGAAVVPVTEPPIGVLADAGDPALVHCTDE